MEFSIEDAKKRNLVLQKGGRLILIEDDHNTTQCYDEQGCVCLRISMYLLSLGNKIKLNRY